MINKRKIFSIFSNKVEKNHQSTGDYKISQFIKYKDLLVQSQKEYALLCGADYEIFEINENNYDKIQFDKLFKMEELSQHYDEILYFDLDVVPRTTENFFNAHDLNTVCAYSFAREPNSNTLIRKLKDNDFDSMNVFAKGCCKKSMLLLDNIQSDYKVINTGIVGCNKYSLDGLSFSDHFQSAYNVYNETIEDNLYPIEISKTWRPNNEVFISYMIEKYNVPFTNIGLQWNFIIDNICPDISAGSKLLHVVHKDFSKVYDR